MPAQEIEQTLTYTIHDMKKGVDFIGVTCVFFCHDGKGNVLMQKRSRYCRDEQGRWDCGAGSMEFGEENFADVVRREVKEAYKIDAIEIEHVATTNVIRDNEGTKTHWICLVHAVLVPEGAGEIGEPHKAEEIGWFSHDTLPEPIHSAVPPHFKLVRDLVVPQQD